MGLINVGNQLLFQRFDFSTLYTKLPHNKLMMVLNNLIDFCFDAGESKYIIVNSYVAR